MSGAGVHGNSRPTSTYSFHNHHEGSSSSPMTLPASPSAPPAPPPPQAIVSQTTIQDKPKSAAERCHAFFKTVYKIVSSSLGLLIILIAYAFAGAAIFHKLEGPHEQLEKGDCESAARHLVAAAWNITESRNGSTEEGFKLLLREELRDYEESLRKAFMQGITTPTDMVVWDFWGAFLFCATVFTTIGYGHIAPVTSEGRMVCMAYALLGIPLCLVVMASLGRLFTRAIKFLWSFIRRFYYTGNCRKVRRTLPVGAMFDKLGRVPRHVAAGCKEAAQSPSPPAEPVPPGPGLIRSTPGSQGNESAGQEQQVDHDDGVEPEQMIAFEVDDEFNLPPIVAIAITVAYILLGAVMYTQWEDWTYLEAFYFIFISISTIGFGDVLPAHPRYFLASSIYILIGLSLVAMVITVIMEVVNSTIDKAKNKVIDVGQRMGINISTEVLASANLSPVTRHRTSSEI